MFKALEDALYDTDMPDQPGICPDVDRDHCACMRPLERFLALSGSVSMMILIVFCCFYFWPWPALRRCLLAEGRPGCGDCIGGGADCNAYCSICRRIYLVSPAPHSDANGSAGVVGLLQLDYAARAVIRRDARGDAQQHTPAVHQLARTLKKSTPICCAAQSDRCVSESVAATLNKDAYDLAPVVRPMKRPAARNSRLLHAEANTFDGTLVAIQAALFRFWAAERFRHYACCACRWPSVDPRAERYACAHRDA